MRRAGVGLDRVGDSEAQCLVDELPARDVVPVDQRDGDAGASGAAGTTDAVDVGLLVLGALVVDDVGDVVDVDTAGSDVGGDQNVDLAVTEAFSAFSRAICPRSPWTAPTEKPRSARSSATFWAVRLVRVKIIVAPRPSACRTRATISALSSACAR